MWGGLTLQVTTRDGAAELAPFEQRVDGFSERLCAPIWSAYGQDLDAAMLDEFIGAIREGRQPHPTGEDGVRTVEIVDAA